MSNISPKRYSGNRSVAAAPYLSLSPILAHALAVGARKLAAESRDDLAPGAYEVDTTVHIVGTLTVGHDSETASTVTPGADVLLGLVLAKLNTATRESILRELPADFAAAGAEYPEVPEAIVEATEALTASLRRKVSQHRRGSVSGQFAIRPVGGLAERPGFAVVG
jgi:hypothetical protein